ncbi:zinc finger, c3HC4 type (RING finger) domain-containing protein [Phthorimaea operculella]|nr:zinc finger, c3HC4 type (RING finger) domain-containing protein [Phthorimaea operculella]
MAPNAPQLPNKAKPNKDGVNKNMKPIKSKAACHVTIEYLYIKCPICFENINKDQISSTRCGHVFCTDCIKRALKRTPKCPICLRWLRGARAHHPLHFHTYSSEIDSEKKSSSDVKMVDKAGDSKSDPQVTERGLAFYGD